MSALVEQVLLRYETGRMTRRQFVASLAALMTGASAKAQEAAPYKGLEGSAKQRRCLVPVALCATAPPQPQRWASP